MKKIHSRFLVYWLPLISYCSFIFILSSIHSPDIMPDVPDSDKILHSGAFVVVAVLFWRAFASLRFERRQGILVLMTLFSSSAYGILIEVNQSFISYRSAEMMDVWADVAGAMVGILLCLWYTGRKPANQSQIPSRTRDV